MYSKKFCFYTASSQGMPLFLSVTEHEEQSNLIVTFYFNFLSSAYNKP